MQTFSSTLQKLSTKLFENELETNPGRARVFLSTIGFLTAGYGLLKFGSSLLSTLFDRKLDNSRLKDKFLLTKLRKSSQSEASQDTNPMTTWVLIADAVDPVGVAFAEKFASLGFNLILIGSNKEKIFDLGSALHSKYRVEFKAVDLYYNKEYEYDTIYDQLRGHIHDIDLTVVVNNVSIVENGDFHLMKLEKIYEMVHVNVMAKTFMNQIAVRKLLERGHTSKKGVIINVTSCLGNEIFVPGLSVFQATKAFDSRCAVTLGNEYKGICVVSLCPCKFSCDFKGRSFEGRLNEAIQRVLEFLGVQESNHLRISDNRSDLTTSSFMT